MPDLSDRDYGLLRKLIHDSVGINFSHSNKDLLHFKVSRRLEALKIGTFEQYYSHLANGDHEELLNLFDAVSTNKTSFFREVHHFDFMRNDFLPRLIHDKREKGKDLSIRGWSAGCSTGEEAYSLAITITELLNDCAQWDVKILASDISARVMEVAKKGIYRYEGVKDMPLSMLKCHFDLGRGAMDGYVKVKKAIRDMVFVKRLNLVIGSYPFKESFDFIFCRNVLIYFDRDTQKIVIEKLGKHLDRDGYLFIGHSESLVGMDTPLVYQKPTIYMKK
jgi:chemotaxis protein methyltransferase CheR